jgi:hypothetical protein
VIAAMRVLAAAGAFLLDVSNLAIRGHFAIAAGDAAAAKRCEPEKSN